MNILKIFNKDSLISIRNSTTSTPSFRPDKIGLYHVSISVDDGKAICAIYTGETRPPKQGEWYLSGAIIEAYRAPNDYLPMDDQAIAQLVLVSIVRTVERVNRDE